MNLMNMISSSQWMVCVIIMGVVLVAIGQIQYPLAKERENKRLAAHQAYSLLHSEITDNLNLLKKMQELIPKREILFEKFDVAAWGTISNSSIMLALDPEKTRQLMQAYHLINQVNDFHARLLEMSIGVTSALTNTGKNRDLLMQSMSTSLSNLRPLLESLSQAQV